MPPVSFTAGRSGGFSAVHQDIFPYRETKPPWFFRHAITYGPSPIARNPRRLVRERIVRYLKLYIADGDKSDNHHLLRGLFREGGDQVLRSIAKLAPGRQELCHFLPTLKTMGACFYLAAVKSTKARGKLAKSASSDLALYLYGIEYERLKRIVKTLQRLAVELMMVNASALASPVYRLLHEGTAEKKAEARRLERLPYGLEAYANRLGEFFEDNSKLRLPQHYDLATAHEYVLLDEIEKATGDSAIRRRGNDPRFALRLFRFC